MSGSNLGRFTTYDIDNSAGTPVDLTSHIIETSGIPTDYDDIEESGFSEDHFHLLGQGDSPVTMTFKYNSTTAPILIHPSTGLNGSNTARTITGQYGQNAAPTTGDYQVTGEYVGWANVVPDKSGTVTIVATFALAGIMPAWSVI